jgi:hypothetical protein
MLNFYGRSLEMFMMVFVFKGLPILLEFIIDEVSDVFLNVALQGEVFHYKTVVRQRSGFFIVILDSFSDVVPYVNESGHMYHKARNSQNQF